jgi:MFS family permease
MTISATSAISTSTAPPRVPALVWVLGWVSLLTDISSEMILAVLPVYLGTVMGVSMATIGLIEGIAEATAAVMRVFAGAIGDKLGRYKAIVVFGYGLSALSKIVFPFAGSAGPIFAARIIDRVGKGLRTAPRDAMIARATHPSILGRAFGIRQSLDTLGAVFGPLLAILILGVTHNDFQLLFWIAFAPGVLAVIVLARAAEEPNGGAAPLQRIPLSRADLARLGFAFWWIAVGAAFLTFGRGAKAFLVLRTEDVGVPLWLVPIAFVIMNSVYAATAYPVGNLSDRIDRRMLLAAGIVVLILSDMMLAMASGPWVGLFGVLLWGLHFGMTQGVLATLVVDSAPESLRGTAFGVFSLLSGFALVASGALGGMVWDIWGPSTLFWLATAAATLSLATAWTPPIGSAAVPR